MFGHKLLLKIIFHSSEDSCITSNKENIVHIDVVKNNVRSCMPNDNRVIILTPLKANVNN